MPEQPDKCHEHHIMLKNSIESMNATIEKMEKQFEKFKGECQEMRCSIFGGEAQVKSGELSFVDKVNVLYNSHNNARITAITIICTFGVFFISSIYFVGGAITKLDSTVNTLTGVVQNQKNIEIELAQIKTKIDK